MSKLSPEDEIRKRAIFDAMSERMQKRVLKIGYDKWDPFELPNDPIDLRQDKNRYTAAMLTKEFLSTIPDEKYSPAYSQGVWDFCVGIISRNDRYMGMLDFARWYIEFNKRINRPGDTE